MITLIDKQNRKTLGEGRSYQMGFAFVKKTPEKDEYTTVQAITACKDYLNDVVWSEHVDKPIVAYGLKYSKVGLFDSNTAYMVLSILPYHYGSDYPNQERDTKNLKENFKLLQEFLNYIEQLLLLDVRTEIEEIADNKYLVKFSYEWCKGTYLISLYTLLIRAGQFYKEGDPLEFLEKFNAMPEDTYLVQGMYPKLKKLIETGFVKQDLEALPGGTTVHNCGIIGYKF